MTGILKLSFWVICFCILELLSAPGFKWIDTRDDRLSFRNDGEQRIIDLHRAKTEIIRTVDERYPLGGSARKVTMPRG